MAAWGSMARVPRWTYVLEEGECRDSLALVTARQFGLAPALLRRAADLAEAFDSICRSPTVASFSSFTSSSSPSPSPSSSSSASGASIDSSTFAGPCARDVQSRVRLALEEVVKEEEKRWRQSDGVSGAGAGGAMGGDGWSEEVVEVPPGFEPPPAMAGRSCVYIIELGSADERDAPRVYYVGETVRMRSHALHRALSLAWKSTLCLPGIAFQLLFVCLFVRLLLWLFVCDFSTKPTPDVCKLPRTSTPLSASCH